MVRQIWTGKPIVRIRSCSNHRKAVVGWLLVCLFITNASVGKATLVFHLQEEQPPGTFVGRVDGALGFQGSPAQFKFDQRSGDISTTTRIDRESSVQTNPIPLTLSTKNSSSQPISVQVQIDDINDNEPRFPTLYFTLRIRETAVVNSKNAINIASDPDAGNNGTVDYAISSGDISATFSLGTSSLACPQGSQLCVITKKSLDRESRGFYQLNVTATDRGSPPLVGYCLVNITILDDNDHAPIFTKSSYDGSVAENTKPGVSILKVSATDLDAGSNGDITYKIEVDGIQSQVIFDLDENTGVIRTKGSLNYEDTSKRSYKFKVIASDKGAPKKTDSAFVTIQVTNENDNAPSITIVYMLPLFGQKAIISEDSDVGQDIAYIQVKDDDDNSINAAQLEITKGNELGCFTLIERDFGLIYINLAKTPDRELRAFYNLTLNATDKGNPPQSTIAFAFIDVTDVNDNSPAFTSNLFTASVNEAAQNGSFVKKMNATDPDAGGNGTVSYSITGGNGLGWFQIDANSGLVTTTKQLNREQFPSVSLTITAQDHGSPPRTGTTTLKITLTDANDNAPVFKKSIYRVTVPEDKTPGALVEQVSATDADIGVNSKIMYEIDTSNQDITNMFVLGRQNGELRTKSQLDRETKSSYTIPVIAKDHGNPQLSSKATVEITVSDINDNAPVFYPVTYFASVMENERPGELVQVTATDADYGNNAAIYYSISGGNGHGNFTIDSTTGMISTLTSLDHEIQELYTLNISAKDGGEKYATRTAVVEVTVLNSADNPPVFMYEIYNFTVYENVPKGTLVGKVYATTKDKNGTVSYDIVSGDPTHLFVMDPSGGIIMVDGKIDREEKAHYFLSILARVGSVKPLTAKASVNIAVLDRNDNTPQFSSSSAHVDVHGTWPVGQIVYSAAATDSDAGSNGVIKYHLTSNANGMFSINSTSGLIKLARKVTESDAAQYTVQVLASDAGSPPLYSTMAIHVTVLINHPPKFTLSSYVTHVLASRPLSYQFLFVSAIDSDAGNNGQLTYSVIQGNDEGLFGIFPGGKLYIKRSLLQARKGSYDIVVMATDSGTPPLKASVPVTIYIQDSNEHRSLFTNNTFRFAVQENSVPGTFVGLLTAQATDPLKTKDIVYSLLSSQNNFAIDARSGRITTRVKLDRESLTKETGGDVYIMQAEAVYNDTTTKRDKAIVIVTVTDLNDNAPIFSRAVYTVTVSERTVPGSAVFRVKAVDVDEGSNAMFTYSLVSGTGFDKFYIGSVSGDLYLNQSLDREDTDSYNLKIQATDTTNPLLSSQALIEITVGDSNDQKPVFSKSNYTVDIAEDLSIGSVVINVNATDKDIGQNALIKYSITSGNLAAAFDIESATGRLIVAKPLDFELDKQYKLLVKAQDHGLIPLSSTVNITVNVLDVNDNHPVFASHPQTLNVNENVIIGFSVGQCSASDRDSSANGQLVYSLFSQSPINTFTVNPGNCDITTTGAVNRENMPSGMDRYQLVVMATDQASPSSKRLSAKKTITIQVVDQNDNSPEFISPPAAATGATNVVMLVKAKDSDSGDNGLVKYSILSGNNNNFFLDPTSGQLRTLRSLSNNVMIYKLTIRAQDSGQPPRSSQTVVSVFKEGPVGSGPTFGSASYTGYVTENQPSGTAVLTVRAAYSQSNLNGNIAYFLTSDNSNRGFKVIESTGEVVTTKGIDRERMGAAFNLVVYAVDKNGPTARTSSVSVSITVRDLNDNPPKFASEYFSVSVNENVPPGSSVYTLTAIDPDEGDNARVTYAITGGNHDNKFRIDSTNGKIYTQGTFDRETRDQYSVNVTASDHGSQVMSSMCVVMVTITDVNDNQPEFPVGYYAFNINEDAAIGSSIGSVNADDADIGDNARLTYTIVGSDRDTFTLNPASGELTLGQSLDREAIEHYVLNVTATDNGWQNTFDASVLVYVNVLDKNDNAPQFTQSEYKGEISESADKMTHILTVQAVDKDAGSNSLVSYSIISGNSGDAFTILANGTILNAQVLDREEIGLYTLGVRAVDQAIPNSSRLEGLTRVVINVTDVNDHSPHFTSSSVAHVSENANVGDVVLTVIAVDADEGDNGEVKYSMMKLDVGAPFSLGREDGVMRVSGSLDRETKQNYSVRVTATDRGVPPKSSNMKIVIVVDDYNDHAPKFYRHVPQVDIDEDSPPGTDIVTVTAHDEDIGSNADLRYVLVTGNVNDSFSINPITGRVRTMKSLDREITPKYVLEIRADDLGVPRKYGVTSVTVVLRDINDNKPKFTKATYIADVMEGEVDSNVLTVIAEDRDEGTNGKVSYQITQGDANGLFVVNQNTGTVGITAVLDRETKAQYSLRVQATDGGNPPLSSSADVIVNVLDKNDHAPVFNPAKLTAKVAEQSATGTTVIQVTATDKDTDTNAALTYSLTHDFGRFTIDPKTGVITTIRFLDRETAGKHQLEVIATDGGQRQGKLRLDVIVEDVNDHNPEFLQSQFQATVSQSAAIGTIVFIVSARDKDTGANAVSDYSITSGNDASVFGIETHTGVIRVSRQVPSSPNQYSLQVQAANHNAPTRKARTTVQISVSTATFPRFLHPDQQVTISELAPVGSDLITVNATGHTNYYIAGGNDGDAFEVEAVRGEVTVKNALDYERQRNYSLIIGANDGSSPPHVGYSTIVIQVQDENDEVPVFSQRVYTARVQEEVSADTTVTTVLATDADSGANAALEYSIVNQGGLPFGISRTTGRIYTTSRIDRETVSSYTIKVRAANTQNRSMASEATVEVTVTDINDNPPTLQPPLTASISEQAPVGSLVMLLHGTDNDEASPLHYGFLPGGNPGGVFTVDASSGNVTLAVALDRETKDVYVLKVFVNDTKHVKTASVTIRVTDVNDNPPRFIAKPYVTQLLESSAVGVTVMNVTAVDADEGTNAEVTYSLLPSPHGSHFVIDSRTGIITLHKKLVFQRSASSSNPNIYNLTARARNVYSPNYHSDAFIQIEVLDTNDHSPVFRKSEYHFFVVVDTGSGVSVGRVEAIDELDYGPNAELRYEVISGNGTGRFRVVPETGVVLVAGSLTSDANKTFYLHVKAKDMGQPSRGATTEVYIDVTEPNLYPPVFTRKLYQVNVDEDKQVGSVLTTVTAADQDGGRNGFVTYAIVSGNNEGYFGVGRSNGSMYAAKALDYEFRESYVLNVTATDGGKVPRSSFTTVEVTLRDVNDNNPVFESRDYHCELPENTPARSVVVCTVRATDRDERGQQGVRYYIATPNSKFIVDEISGAIRATASFDYEITTRAVLSVGAKDMGSSPQRFADPRAIVHILITGKNEFKPVFTKTVFTATVAENAPHGHSVLQVSASDQDYGPDGVVLYHLVGSDNHQGFSLNPNTGILSVSGDLDNEKASTVTLRVIAKNLLQNVVTPSTVDHATIIVTVTDANDPPRFLKSVYTGSVVEGSRIGYTVTNVTAVDDDSDIRSIRYGIGSGNTGVAFTINALTGVITTAGELDRETVPEYRLTVTATDDGTPPMTGNATVIVTLGDINDNAPHLVPAPCTGHVRENQPQGTRVATLRAEDPDLEPNRGPYTYVISGSDYGKFRLDSASGALSTTVMLDRESVDSYNLSIRVSDRGGQSAISHCLIRVRDVNDNRPRGTSRYLYVNTYENRFPGGVVADVRPDDPDVDDVMTCALLSSPSNLFSFPRGNCELSSLVYTGNGLFDLSVNGSDGIGVVTYSVKLKFLGFTQSTVLQSVAVRLRNTNPSQFLGTSYKKFVSAIDGILDANYMSQIFSVQSSGEGLVDVLISVQKNSAVMAKEKVSKLLEANRDKIERDGAVDIETVDYTPCSTGNPCKNGGECSSDIRVTGGTSVVSSVPVIMVSARYNWQYTCSCKSGFTGDKCEHSVNDCTSNPCRHGGTCSDNIKPFHCTCAPGYTGRHCETDIDECLATPCVHATSCDNTPGGYRCRCKPGYTGQNCDTDINYCLSAPCMHSSTCEDRAASYKCHCDYGGRGDRCELSSFGFARASFMKFLTLASKNQMTYNNVSLQFATSSPDGLLFYNGDGTNQSDGDFIALQIVAGKLWFSYNLGFTSTPEVIKSDLAVADGKWHHVTVLRDKTKGELIVDYCCKETGSVEGSFTQLELKPAPFLVGGVENFDAMLSDPRKHVQVYDFAGCIRDLYVNGDPLEAHGNATAGWMNRCPRQQWCTADRCRNGGTCVDSWLDYHCECPDGYSGRNCEKVIEAFRFSASSYLVLAFKESYRREEKLKRKQAVATRKRRDVVSVPGKQESFSIKFRTRQDGLILLAQDSTADFTIVQITSGKVSYSFKAGNAGQSLSITSKDVTDGNWHNVTLQRDGKKITLTLGTEVMQRDFAVTPHEFLGTNTRTWSLGGTVSSPAGVTLEKFKGCMEELKINGVNTPMHGPNRFMVPSPHGGAVTEGCVTSGECKSNPCAGNKEKTACYEEWDSYTCVSAAPCKPNPCANNGTCKPQKDETFLCVCAGNFTGSRCTIPFVCVQNPCGTGLICEGDGAGGRVCLSPGKRAATESPISVGIIAAVVFLIVVLVGILVGVLAVKRHQRLKRQSDYDTKHCEEICVPTDLQDASQRTSPSHSSDDSGVVIRNPSQKSIHDLHSSSAEESKNIVIHNVGAPEDYQIKLTKSDERIDHGFSESDIGEFVIRNDFIPKHGSKERLNPARKQQHSTPIERDNMRPAAPRRPRTRDRKAPGSLARQVLDRRQYGPHRSDPRNRPPSYIHQHRKRRTSSMDTTSSEEPQDFSETWPRSDMDNNSERLDYYDIDVASIAQSEASYQYEPSHFKDSMVRRDLPGFSPAEIERIRQQARHPPSGSFLDAVSSSSDDAPTVDDKLSSLMEHPDLSSSESSDDTFTCSEFEYDNERPASRAEEVDPHGTPHGSMVFSKLASTQPGSRIESPRHGSHSTLNMSDDELIIANRLAHRPVNGTTNEGFNWDDVLNWGLRYHNLRGVYKDIAELPDGEGEEELENDEEYV